MSHADNFSSSLSSKPQRAGAISPSYWNRQPGTSNDYLSRSVRFDGLRTDRR